MIKRKRYIEKTASKQDFTTSSRDNWSRLPGRGKEGPVRRLSKQRRLPKFDNLGSVPRTDMGTNSHKLLLTPKYHSVHGHTYTNKSNVILKITVLYLLYFVLKFCFARVFDCGCAHTHVQRSEDTSRNKFSLSIIWVLRIEVRPSDLVPFFWSAVWPSPSVAKWGRRAAGIFWPGPGDTALSFQLLGKLKEKDKKLKASLGYKGEVN